MVSALAALRLKRLTGLPLVIDFRDAWALDPYVEGSRLIQFSFALSVMTTRSYRNRRADWDLRVRFDSLHKSPIELPFKRWPIAMCWCYIKSRVRPA